MFPLMPLIVALAGAPQTQTPIPSDDKAVVELLRPGLRLQPIAQTWGADVQTLGLFGGPSLDVVYVGIGSGPTARSLALTVQGLIGGVRLDVAEPQLQLVSFGGGFVGLHLALAEHVGAGVGLVFGNQRRLNNSGAAVDEGVLSGISYLSVDWSMPGIWRPCFWNTSPEKK